MDKLLKVRTYKKWGFQLQYWLIDGTKWGSNSFESTRAVTWPEGYYIGNSKTAYRICVKRGIRPQPIEIPEHKEPLPNQEAKDLLLEEPRDNAPVCSIGYNKKQRKWYGWSHRAMYGFSIGSKVRKGDCGYKPVDPKDLLDDIMNFFINSDAVHEIIIANESMKYGDTDQFKHFMKRARAAARKTDLSSMTDLPTVHVESPSLLTKRKNDIGCYFKIKTIRRDGSEMIVEHFEPHPIEWGKGEWTAKTMEDAKQMAIDFAEGVA
jgi:hypothetical protein